MLTVSTCYCVPASGFSFIIISRTYQDLPRSFRAPTGIPGAVVGIVIFVLQVQGNQHARPMGLPIPL